MKVDTPDRSPYSEGTGSCHQSDDCATWSALGVTMYKFPLMIVTIIRKNNLLARIVTALRTSHGKSPLTAIAIGENDLQRVLRRSPSDGHALGHE